MKKGGISATVFSAALGVFGEFLAFGVFMGFLGVFEAFLGVFEVFSAFGVLGAFLGVFGFYVKPSPASSEAAY